MAGAGNGEEFQGASGCAKGCLGILIVIAVLFFGGVLLDALDISFGDDPVRATIHVEVNEYIVTGLRLGGPGCDMSGYDLIVSSPGRSSSHASVNLGSGRFVEPSFCRFTVNTDLPERDEYTLRIQTHSGDTSIVSKTVAYDDVLVKAGGGDVERLVIDVRWYNQRDSD